MDFKIDNRVIQLNKILSEIDNLYQTMLSVKGLSDSEYIVMFAILSLGEGCLQKDIAENGFMSKKTINATIKKLQKDEFIKLKAGKYPNMHIYLTEKGEEYVKEKVIPVIETEKIVLDSMSSDAFDILASGYTKYIEKFRELVKIFAKK